jgi:hypothetical protein
MSETVESLVPGGNEITAFATPSPRGPARRTL